MQLLPAPEAEPADDPPQALLPALEAPIPAGMEWPRGEPVHVEVAQKGLTPAIDAASSELD